ncbi:MAG: hypothetical protein KDD44_09100 [Bdellovibrionales bacterium]|nr:hypothetical protein [Bdellovibrionales bacterium]
MQRMRPKRLGIVALIWGFAEATLFFIVADVLLTFSAVGDREATRRACVSATIGALLGGSLMYVLSSHYPGSLDPVFLKLPGVHEQTLLSVIELTERLGAFALFPAGFLGIPYKLFAAEFGERGINFPLFFIASGLARWLRFSVTSECVGWLFAGPFKSVSQRIAFGALAIAWSGFYLWYFTS